MSSKYSLFCLRWRHIYKKKYKTFPSVTLHAYENSLRFRQIVPDDPPTHWSSFGFRDKNKDNLKLRFLLNKTYFNDS